MKILNKIKNIYNKKHKAILKFLNPNKKFNIEFFKKGSIKQISINENTKRYLVGDYNFYGIYQQFTKLWIWATSIPGIDTRYSENIKFIKSFSHLFEAKSDVKSNFYYQLLTQDVILLTDERNMISWINELLLYLSDDIYIFNPVNSESNIQFITLVNIKEKYL
jgi:hypothetical protein